MKKEKPILIPITAFLLSVLCFLFILALYGVLGYGNNTILRGDLYVQYIDFINLFLRVLKGKEDFWYTFSQYYGSPSILTYAYYAFSPLNLLYLFDFVSIPTMTAIIITIKLGLCGAFFSIFAKQCLKCSNAAAIFFAICYAMNSFNVTLHFNIIWLESAYLLPIIILLIYRLIKTGKFLALIPVFSFLFISNFYMAFISGLFVASVYIIMLFRQPITSREQIKKAFHTSLRFAASVILAAGICAAILFPCAKFLLSHMAADNTEFTPLPTSTLDILNSMFLGVMPDIDNRIPFLYCGLPVLLLVIHYFLQKTIPLRERVLAGILLGICFLSIVFLPLFILTHAFDYPNFYFFRNSAFICFLLCAIACRCFSHTGGVLPARSLWPCIGILIMFYSFMIRFWPLYSDDIDITNNSNEMALNIVFFILWGIMFSPVKALQHIIKKKELLLKICCFALLLCELSMNGWISLKHMDFTTFSEYSYDNWYQAESNALAQIPADDDQLYRISMYGDNNYNACALFGYAGFNTFSSSDQYPLRQALFNLGISVSNRSITELGYTDLTYMLFDKGYTCNIIRLTDDSDERHSTTEAFPWRLSIAYTVSDDILNYSPGPDPFTNQELLAKAMSGKDYHFFDRLDISDLTLSSYNAKVYSIGDNTLFSKSSDYFPTAGVYFSLPKNTDSPFYACFRQDYPSAIASAPYILGSTEGYAESFTLSQGCLIKGGKVSDEFDDNTDNVVVYFNETSLMDYPCTAMNFARFNNTELPALYADLLPGTLTLNEWSTSHLKGTVTASEEHPLLFTSIPWDDGWKAVVDGQPCECESVMDNAFLTLRLAPGTHNVELYYDAPGRRAGLVVSIISLIVTLLIFIASFRNHQ